MPRLDDTYLRLRRDTSIETLPALNPRGTWHAADVHEASQVLFITAGEGTETRPR